MEQPKSIGLYINDILYNTGGTESYTVKIGHALLAAYPHADITFVTECYAEADRLSDEDFIDNINGRFGTAIAQGRGHVLLVPGRKGGGLSALLLGRRLEAASARFDLFFYGSRGHHLFRAKKNAAIIHFPMERLAGRTGSHNPVKELRRQWLDRAYAARYDAYLPNSRFTEGWLKKWWPDIPSDKITVLYPPISPVTITGEAKERLILVCSRIERSKSLEVLIDAYRSSSYLSSTYRLIIAGGEDFDDPGYTDSLKDYARNTGIEFILNSPWTTIESLYNRAQLFWHAKGYGSDEDKDPYRMEHLGITTVEAMSVGCVPLVINKAGQKEIVTPECGFRWNTPEELVRYTEQVAQDPALMADMARAAQERAALFKMETFIANLQAIIGRL